MYNGFKNLTHDRSSLKEIKSTLKKHSKLIDQIASDTQSLRESHKKSFTPGDEFSVVTSSILSTTEIMSTDDDAQREFAFDNLLVNAGVYRRAFHKFIKVDEPNNVDGIRSKFIEEDLIDLSTPDEVEAQNLLQSESLNRIFDDLRFLDGSNEAPATSARSMKFAKSLERKPVPKTQVKIDKEMDIADNLEPHNGEPLELVSQQDDIDWGDGIRDAFSAVVNSLGMDETYRRPITERRKMPIVKIPTHLLRQTGTVAEVPDEADDTPIFGLSTDSSTTKDRHRKPSGADKENKSIRHAKGKVHETGLVNVAEKYSKQHWPESAPQKSPFVVLYDKEDAHEFSEDVKQGRTYLGVMNNDDPYSLSMGGEVLVSMMLQVVDRAAEIAHLILMVSNDAALQKLSRAYTKVSDYMSLLNNYTATVQGKSVVHTVGPLIHKFEVITEGVKKFLTEFKIQDKKSRGWRKGKTSSSILRTHEAAIRNLVGEIIHLIPQNFKKVSDVRLAITGVATRIPKDITPVLYASVDGYRRNQLEL
jgi:hypothetical protein